MTKTSLRKTATYDDKSAGRRCPTPSASASSVSAHVVLCCVVLCRDAQLQRLFAWHEHAQHDPDDVKRLPPLSQVDSLFKGFSRGTVYSCYLAVCMY